MPSTAVQRSTHRYAAAVARTVQPDPDSSDGSKARRRNASTLRLYITRFSARRCATSSRRCRNQPWTSQPTPTSPLKLGSLNIFSAVNKTGNIHDTINEFRLDLLALCETKTHEDDPPDGFPALHVHRDLAAAHPTGGGLAVVYHDTLDVCAAQLPSLLTTYRTFEYQLIRVSSMRPAVTLANVYRPPSTSVSLFYSEFSEFLSSVGSAFNNFVVCGDLNCPGPTSMSVAEDLAATFDAFGLSQHVCWPTRNDNVLDVLATDDIITAGEVRVALKP